MSPALTCLAMSQNRFSRQSKDNCSPMAKYRKQTHIRDRQHDAFLLHHHVFLQESWPGYTRRPTELCAALKICVVSLAYVRDLKQISTPSTWTCSINLNDSFENKPVAMETMFGLNQSSHETEQLNGVNKTKSTDYLREWRKTQNSPNSWSKNFSWEMKW